MGDKPRLKPFFTSGSDPRSENRTLDLHALLVEWVHSRLHIVFIDFVHELAHGLLGLWRGRVRGDRA